MSGTQSGQDARHIGQRQTDMRNGMMQPLQDRIAALEAECAALRAQLAGLEGEAAILAFARLLATKLHTPHNEAKGDWRRDSTSAIDAIKTEWWELYQAAHDTEPLDRQAVVDEACDVALWAMICADRYIALCDHDGRGRTGAASPQS